MIMQNMIVVALSTAQPSYLNSTFFFIKYSQEYSTVRSWVWDMGCELTLNVLNFSEGQKTYIYILSFLHIGMTQVVEILPQVR